MTDMQITWHASGKAGAVAAGGEDAVAAGMRALQDGGNAADAAVATMLALAITDYGAFAIGGEIPFVIYDAEKEEVKVLCGVGRAPVNQTAIDWYYEHGIPDDGSYKAMPVPGALHLCLTALAQYGTKSFADVVAPTLDLLHTGGPDWHQNLAATLRKMVQREQDSNGSRQQKLRAARDRFYHGDIADDLVAWYRDTGSFLRKHDLEAHDTVLEDPVSIDCRGFTVHKCDTWTQGPVLLQALRLLEGHSLQEMRHLSADYVHLLTEAMKLAYADRDTYYGDPAFANVPMAELLSDEYTDMRAALIDMAHASDQRRPGDPNNMKPLLERSAAGSNDVETPISDTTTCVTADRFGNIVAATPSCNLVGNEPDPHTGVSQGNRLRSLNTTPDHPNRIEPGKRPRVTLTPTLVTKDGRPVIAISVAGGDLQDQTTLNVLLNHIEFAMPPKDALTAPRFNTDHMENSFDSDPDRDRAFMSPASLQVNDGVPDAVRRDLTARGHTITATGENIAAPVMLSIDPDTGQIHAAGDPAADRHAAAL